MTYRHATAGRLSPERARAVVARLAYSLPGLRRCELDATTQEIVVELGEPSPDVGSVVERMVTEAAAIRVARPRVLRRTAPAAHRRAGAGDVPPEARLDLLQAVDRRMLDLACAAGARRRAYGSLIRLSTMARCDYLRSFPQHAYLVSELPHDWRELERARDLVDITSRARVSEYMLAPAVCFHCYEEHAEARLPAPLVVTALGTCFRHEAEWRVGGPRLREFSMREVVFIGDPGFVEATRTRLLERVWRWFERLGLAGRVETASDPFYAPADTVKAQYQLMAGAKYELLAELHTGEELALASFNNMRDSLCVAFDIACASGVAAHSGCAAFGVERWAHALLTELGAGGALRALAAAG